MDCIIKLLQSPSDEALDNAVKKLKSSAGQELMKIKKFRDVLLSTLILLLKTGSLVRDSPRLFKRQETAVENVVQLLSLALSQGTLSDPQMFTGILGHLGLFLDSNAQGKSVGEDVKLRIVKCFTILLFTSTSELKEGLHEGEGRKTLAVAVHALLSVAKEEKSKELKLEAVKLIGKLLDIEVSEAEKKANVISSILPGVLKTVMEVCLQDAGQKIVSIGLSVIRAVIRYSLLDSYFSVDERSDFSSLVEHRKEKKTSEKEYPSPMWLKFTQPRLEIVVSKISKLRSSEAVSTRTELLKIAEVVLLHCRRSLPNCVPNLLDVTVGFVDDENEEVKEHSQKLLKELSNSVDFELYDQIYERMYYVAANSLRIVRLGNSLQQVAELRLLSGYLRLLKLKTLDVSVVKYLLKTLITIAELEGTGVAHFQKGFPLGFRYLIEDTVISQFRHVCMQLGTRQTFVTVIDVLDELLDDALIPKGSILLVRLYCITGFKTNGEPTDVEIDYVARITDECITSLKQRATSSLTTIRDMNMASFKTCVLIKTLGALAQSVGPKFQPFLIRSLYLVLGAAGKSNVRSSSDDFMVVSALKTLHSFAAYVGGCTLPAFLKQNSDYVTSQVCIAMTDEAELINVSRTIRAVADLGGSVGLSCATAAARSAIRLLKTKGVKYSRLMLLFQACGEAMIALERSPMTLSTESAEKPSEKQGAICRFILDHEETCRASENLHDEPLDNHCGEEGNSDEESEAAKIINQETGEPEKKPVPEKIRVAADIVHVCRNYVNSSDPELVCLSLDAIGSSLKVLQSDEDSLLPVVHDLWSPVLAKLKQENPRLRISSASLLGQMVAVSGRFLRARIVKDAFPLLLSTVESMGRKKISCFSQEHKLLKEILRVFSVFCQHLELSVIDGNTVLSACAGLLLPNQDKELKDLVEEVFRVCAHVPCLSDQAWLILSAVNGSCYEPRIGALKIERIQFTRRRELEIPESLMKSFELKAVS